MPRESDGSRDESTVLPVNTNGTISGTFGGAVVAIDWNWDNDLYCRSGPSSSAESQTIIEFQCQVVTIESGIVTFENSQDGSDARSYFIE